MANINFMIIHLLYLLSYSFTDLFVLLVFLWSQLTINNSEEQALKKLCVELWLMKAGTIKRKGSVWVILSPPKNLFLI